MSTSPDTMNTLAGRWAQVTASDLMRTNVVVVHFATPIDEVARTLADNRISGAPVVDEAGHIIGVVSVSDLVSRMAESEGGSAKGVGDYFRYATDDLDEADLDGFEISGDGGDTARDVMNAEIYSVAADASLADIAETMFGHRIHRVLVKDQGKYVGLLSTMEVLQVLSPASTPAGTGQ